MIGGVFCPKSATCTERRKDDLSRVSRESPIFRPLRGLEEVPRLTLWYISRSSVPLSPCAVTSFFSFPLALIVPFFPPLASSSARPLVPDSFNESSCQSQDLLDSSLASTICRTRCFSSVHADGVVLELGDGESEAEAEGGAGLS